MSKGWVEPFGDGVRRLREARGWTQYELAQQAGVSQSVIRDVEHAGKDGNYEPRQDTVRGIVRAFGNDGITLLREAGRDELADYLESGDVVGATVGDLGLSPREKERLGFIVRELMAEIRKDLRPETQDKPDSNL